jgi:2-polyprenyl-6-methoxyphenol hydroxylase-like FAD-dependent oxidoreductase
VSTHSDVVVVGASVAGCTAARLLALEGASVTLVEKRPDPEAYKVLCTHYIQPSAMPSIERLGLAGPMREAGAAPAMVDLWTRWGWIDWQNTDYHGLNLRRSVLDPLLRKLTTETPGVTFLPGRTLTGVVKDGGRVRGVTLRGREGDEETIGARLVVGADGRGSDTARFAGVVGRRRPHGRFGYFSYFRGVPLVRGTRAQLWLQDPEITYVFPGDDDVTCIAAFFADRSRVDEVRADPDAAMRERFAGLPDAPDPWAGEHISKWIGKLTHDNQRRPAAAPGVAFVGDAAQASDPVWGVGVGFAFQSGDWLAQEVGGALRGSDDELDRALERYASVHRKRLAAHHWVMSDYATGRKLNAAERLLFSAAARDPRLARRFERFGSRDVTPGRFMPGALARAAAVNLRHLVAT